MEVTKRNYDIAKFVTKEEQSTRASGIAKQKQPTLTAKTTKEKFH